MRSLLVILSAFFLGHAASTAGQPDDTSAHPGAMVDSVQLVRLIESAEYPLIQGSPWTGALPVENPTEIPNPALEYKFLFEIIEKNPDSLAGQTNFSLDEIARILNLHVASGISPSNLKSVIIVHGPGIELATHNTAYAVRHAMDNPNIGMIRDLEQAGASFIVCGQAMAFFQTTRDELLPGMKVTLSTQTAISSYQLQGYVRYAIVPDR